jgi:hypothetical protein
MSAISPRTAVKTSSAVGCASVALQEAVDGGPLLGEALAVGLERLAQHLVEAVGSRICSRRSSRSGIRFGRDLRPAPDRAPRSVR